MSYLEVNMSEEIVDTVEEFDAIRSAYEETGDTH